MQSTSARIIPSAMKPMAVNSTTPCHHGKSRGEEDGIDDQLAETGDDEVSAGQHGTGQEVAEQQGWPAYC